MLTTTKAIVLHAFRYGEAKLIIDLLTADGSRMACIATLPKSPRAKLKKQYFQPLYILEVVADVRPRTNLQRLKEAGVAVPLTSIPFSPAKTAITLFTAEFLRNATRREPLDPAAFAYVENSIRWLDGCAGHFANFHLVFMMRMAKFLGFYPNLDGYTPGCRFDLRASCFRQDAPLHGDCLPPAEASHLARLMRMNYDTMRFFRLSRAERARCLEVILSYYRLHVPAFPVLKSPEVLKELFD